MMVELDSGADGSGVMLLDHASHEEAKPKQGAQGGIGLFSYGMRKRKIKKPQ